MACRTGDRQELTKGTLTYAAITALLVPLLYTAPINLIACSALFLGDGFADPVGRLLGSNPVLQYRVAYFGAKSIPGTLACFVASFVGSVGWAHLFNTLGHYTTFDARAFLHAALICSGVAAIVEGVSPPDVDNILIPVSVILTGFYLSGWDKYKFLFHTMG
eukprot:CAMPEP_0173088362 /NCGR_PEP_ID=MMETSP1102-20130122/24882_1 /TAXON_ID=49646 /ORGANISM="Geminigera sp., Strain Caron Lab Isolate" /LENGTH=161 /DNA_ID=CAMNT_0013971237 /DNA_START=52 /DNA_END=537 /DNA_ORIENTATION=+